MEYFTRNVICKSFINLWTKKHGTNGESKWCYCFPQCMSLTQVQTASWIYFIVKNIRVLLVPTIIFIIVYLVSCHFWIHYFSQILILALCISLIYDSALYVKIYKLEFMITLSLDYITIWEDKITRKILVQKVRWTMSKYSSKNRGACMHNLTSLKRIWNFFQ